MITCMCCAKLHGGSLWETFFCRCVQYSKNARNRPNTCAGRTLRKQAPTFFVAPPPPPHPRHLTLRPSLPPDFPYYACIALAEKTCHHHATRNTSLTRPYCHRCGNRHPSTSTTSCTDRCTHQGGNFGGKTAISKHHHYLLIVHATKPHRVYDPLLVQRPTSTIAGRLRCCLSSSLSFFRFEALRPRAIKTGAARQ